MGPLASWAMIAILALLIFFTMALIDSLIDARPTKEENHERSDHP